MRGSVHRWWWLLGLALALLGSAARSDAQNLPKITWRLAPSATALLTLAVNLSTDPAPVQGWVDEGGGRHAAYGAAFGRPNGTVGVGLTVVSDGSGASDTLAAVIDPVTHAGVWHSGRGASGTLELVHISVPEPPTPPEEPEPEPQE